MTLQHHSQMSIARWCAKVAISVAIFICPIPTAHCAALIIPVIGEGDTGNNTAVRNLERTLQIAYSSSLLGDLLPGSYITGLSFRLNSPYPSWPDTELTWGSYDIQLSTSLNAPGFLNPTFDLNIGPDVTTVRTGPLTVASLSYSGGSSPNAFGPEISFLSPYTYAGGDLLITIRHTGNGVATQFMDSQSSAAGAHQAHYAPSYTASVADQTDPINTPVVKFSYSAVPEPSTYALLLMTGAGALWWVRRRGGAE